MSSRNTLIIGVVGLAIVILLLSSLYRVQVVEQALVLQFGEPVAIVKEPGLHFKKPFIQNVEYYDKRLVQYDIDDKQVIMGDQKWLIVDAYVRYRITDPLKYKQTVRNEVVMRDRLDSIVDASLRQVLGRIPLEKVISKHRSEIMQAITAIVNSAASGKPLPDGFDKSLEKIDMVADVIPPDTAGEEQPAPVKELLEEAVQTGGFGIEVVDVRIKRADLPEDNSQSIYRRMITERQREAKEIRAEGEEESQKIRARANKERVEILSKAEKEAEVIRGHGDATATKVFADAFNRDKDFYAFYRSLKAYETSLQDDDTMMVLSPGSEFLKYMHKGQP